MNIDDTRIWFECLRGQKKKFFVIYARVWLIISRIFMWKFVICCWCRFFSLNYFHKWNWMGQSKEPRTFNGDQKCSCMQIYTAHKDFSTESTATKNPSAKIDCMRSAHRVLFLSLVVVAWLFLAFFYSRKKIIPRKKIKSICRKQKGKITTTVAAQKLHVCHSLYDERGTCHAMRFCSKIMNKNETQRNVWNTMCSIFTWRSEVAKWTNAICHCFICG